MGGSMQTYIKEKLIPLSLSEAVQADADKVLEAVGSIKVKF